MVGLGTTRALRLSMTIGAVLRCGSYSWAPMTLIKDWRGRVD